MANLKGKISVKAKKVDGVIVKEEKTDFGKIEKKWQDAWEKAKVFEAKENLKKKKFYVLEMFPYPSGTGIHMGHAFNYNLGDIFARFKFMQGFNVIHPGGYDSLGLPAENAAIKAGIHPEDYTNNSIKNFMKQQKTLGLTYDWSRMVNTADPNYYRWDQWIFLKMFEKGLVYQKEAPINWCPKCNTILANEQVVNGKCWRHEDTNVEVRKMDQWYLKITDYADRLLDHSKLNWPEKTIAMQKNWIGKSFGTEIDFEISTKLKFVLLHGFTGKADGVFFPWLKRELEKRGYEVNVPQLPNADSPNIIEQAEYVLKNCKFDEDTVLLGHSLGSVVALKVLEKLNRPIKKLITVGGFALPSPKDRSYNKTIDWKFDFGKIKSNVKEIKILKAKNDSSVYGERADSIKNNLGGDVVEFIANKDHVCGKEEPEVLNACLERWPIFTTRPDTLFGVTFMVVSAQHHKLNELVTKEQKKKVDEFLGKLKSVSEKDMADMEKEGVFTGSYAINPLTKEKVPVYAGNFVVADYGSGMVMAVPAHDQRDFDFAKKYGIPIKQVIAPLFVTDKGIDAVREDKKTVERDAVFGIVKHWKEDKYFVLDWKNFGWKSLIIGGVEDGETSEEAIAREVKEETGYQDIKSVKRIGFETHANFFARHKDVNRYGRFKTYLIELKSDKFVKPNEEDVKNHTGQWMEKSKIKNYLNLSNQNYIWDIYLNGEGAYTEMGKLISSGEFNGLNNEEAKIKIADSLIKKGIARKKVNYKLRDWSVARQRYWGTPIPLIHCQKCGVVPVPEKDLPVKLPKDVKFGKGNPLETNEKWLNVKCPKCNGKARREANTLDTFVNSSWYFLRYCDPKNDKQIFAKEKVKYWMPVDLYIGGAEHACMHLIYCRFYTMFLKDLGLIDFDEPAPRLFHQGMINGSDGEKMSKSKGNGIEPLEAMKKYGVDGLRYYLISVASPDKGFNWDDKSIQGSLRLINKVYTILDNVKIGKDSNELLIKLNNSIKNVTQQIEGLDYRKASIELRELFDTISSQKEASKASLEKALKLLSPFCPHITEELWQKIGNNKSGKEFISIAPWPKVEEVKIGKGKELGVMEKIIENVSGMIKRIEEKNKVNKVYLYVMPFEIKQIDEKKIAKALGKETKIFAVNDSGKYDPEGRSGKARPGMPGIFVE